MSFANFPVLLPTMLNFSFKVVAKENDEQKFSRELLTDISVNPSYLIPLTSR